MRLPVVIATLLLLTGCASAGPDSQPVRLPPITDAPSASASASPTASPTPSAVALQVPPQATPATRDGAAAFATYWWSVWNDAYTRLDASELMRLSKVDCKSCQAYSDNIKRVRNRHQHYVGGDARVREALAPPGLAPGQPIPVLVSTSFTPARLIAADGGIVKEIPGETDANLVVTLSRTTSGWLVSSVETR